MSAGYALLTLTRWTVGDDRLNRSTFAYSKPLWSVAQSVNAQTVVPTVYSPAEVIVSMLGSVHVRSRWPLDKA
jgi:hypothetical protein